MDYLPMFARLEGRPVLLVGGGEVALRKARLLLAAGARLTLVSPELEPEFHEFAGRFTHVAARFDPAHLAGQIGLGVDDLRFHPKGGHCLPRLCQFLAGLVQLGLGQPRHVVAGNGRKLVDLVRALYGVQTADKVNKACLVTSSYFTRDAVAFAENQNVMIDLIDGDALHDMIVRSAEKYEQENYRRW